VTALGQDVRLGVRGFLRNPGLTALTVLVLALGIGANTAIFSVVDALVLRPLPFPAPEQLVAVPNGVMFPDFVDVRQQSRSFSELAAYRMDQTVLTGHGEPDTVSVVSASPQLFDLLGVAPALGRSLVPGEDQPGRTLVAVISHRFWQRHLGGDPAAIGRSVTLDGQNYQVVGIMPPVFRFPLEDGGGDVWMPLWAVAGQARQWRGFRALRCVGRLAPGVSIGQAQAEVAGIAARLAQQYPKDNAGRGFSTLALYDRTVKVGRPALLVLLGAVALVLLVACANVANLQLVRAAARRREIAVRAALGAGRGRIIRQFLTESALLALLGALAGLVVAFWGVKILAGLLPNDLPRLDRIGFDGRVLAYTLAISALTALAVGLATALQASNVDLGDALKQGERGTSSGRQRLRSLLLVAEIALALTLLVGAGLLVRSFERLVSVDPGFDPRGLLVARLITTTSNVPPPRLYGELLPRLEALPGVRSAAIASQVPFSSWFGSWNFTLDDRPEPPPDNPWWTNVRNTSPGYLRTVGIALLHGRALDRLDEQPPEPQVAVINQSFARRYWPGGNPLGRRIRAYNQYDLRIVGVVADTLGTCGFAGCAGGDAGRLDRSPDPEIHIPMKGRNRTWYLALRTAGDPRALIGPLRAAVHELQPKMPLTELQTMEAAMESSLGQRRAIMLMFSLFAALALLLAVVGLYGVMSYSVAQRTREFGVRMALGALGSDVQKLVVVQGLRLCLVGLGVGVLAALALTHVLGSQLYGVSATDPLTFGGLAGLLLAVATVAAVLPARRATRIDPMVALRSD
jgi:putative ABC transport system permease protein